MLLAVDTPATVELGWVCSLKQRERERKREKERERERERENHLKTNFASTSATDFRKIILFIFFMRITCIN